MFSAEKRQWSGASSPVALSWHVSPHRTDFDFRTKIFGGFPKSQRHSKPLLLKVG